MNNAFTVGQQVTLIHAPNPVGTGWRDGDSAIIVKLGRSPEGKDIAQIRRGDGRLLNVTTAALEPIR